MVHPGEPPVKQNPDQFTPPIRNTLARTVLLFNDTSTDNDYHLRMIIT